MGQRLACIVEWTEMRVYQADRVENTWERWEQVVNPILPNSGPYECTHNLSQVFNGQTVFARSSCRSGCVHQGPRSARPPPGPQITRRHHQGRSK